MIERLGLKKIIFAVLLFAVIASPAAAEWDITVPDHVSTDGDSIFTSPGEQTVVFVEVRTSQFDEPVTDSGTTDASKFYYRYNASEGERENLTYYQDGLWYAKFEADLDRHGLAGDNAQIRFDVKGDRKTGDGVNSGGWQNTSLKLKAGKHEVDIVEGLPSTLIPGEEVSISVNVSNRSSGEDIKQSEVQVYFRNASWMQNGHYDLQYDKSTGLYEGSVTIPSAYDSKYLMRVTSKNRSNKVANAQGAISRFIDTSPELEGELENLTGVVGCESAIDDPQTVYGAFCEPGGELEAVFNNTGAEVDNITLEAFRLNKSTEEVQRFFKDNMTPEEGLYKSDLEIPEINTSAYLNEVLIRFTLSRGERRETLEYPVGYKGLRMIHTGTRSTVQGQTYDLKFQAVKPISLTPYQPSEVHGIEVNLTDPSGDMYASYNSSNFTFDDQEMRFQRDIEISQTAETGGWDLQIFGSKYSETYTENSGFSVSSSEMTFEVNDTKFEKEESGVEDFNLTVKNLEDSQLTLDTNLSKDLEGELELNETYNISATSVRDIPVTVNLTEYQDLNGHLNLTDVETGFVRTVDLEVDTQNCRVRAAHICSPDSRWVNMTAEDRGQLNADLEFRNTKEDNLTNLTTDVEGNISDLIGLEDKYVIEEDLTVQVNYTVETAGNYSGAITFQTDNGSEMVFNTTLETTFEPVEGTEFSTSPESIDLGVFPRGNERTADINIQNAGQIELENIEASSQDYLVNLNVTDLNVSADSVKTVELIFEGVETSEGQVTLTGETPEGENSVTLDVSGTPVQDYADRASELTSRKQELEPVRGSNLTQTMTEVSGTITEIRTAWGEGNYLEAKSLFNEAQNKLDYVANNKVSTGGQDDGGNDEQQTGGDQSDNPDNQGGDQGGADTGGPSTTENEGGGLPIIPIIIVVIVVLLIAGFVFYESYIPEEGDPLYGVLGEE